MTAVLAIAAVVIYCGLLLVAQAIRNQTREFRAIAEQEADERRQAGIAAGFDAGWHTTSRRAR